MNVGVHRADGEAASSRSRARTNEKSTACRNTTAANSRHELQIPIAHQAAALPLVVAQGLQLGGELRNRERRVTVLGAPGFVGDPQVPGRQRGAVGLVQPLLDKGGDVGADHREPASRPSLLSRRTSLGDGPWTRREGA